MQAAEGLIQPNRRLLLNRRGIMRLAGLFMALSVSVGVLRHTAARQLPQRVPGLLQDAKQKLSNIEFKPLPDISVEVLSYESEDEKFIYTEIANAKSGDKKLPVMESVLAVSAARTHDQSRRPLAIYNPILIHSAPSGKQYLVGHSSVAVDTAKTLVYRPLDEFRLCTTNDSAPMTVNRSIGVNRLTGAFGTENIGSLLYVPDEIDAVCERSVSTSEINGNTLAHMAQLRAS